MDYIGLKLNSVFSLLISSRIDMYSVDYPLRSFYQSHDYVNCLRQSNRKFYTTQTEAGLVVAAEMQDGGFEVWEGPQRKDDVIQTWTWLIDCAKCCNADYARMVLPINVSSPDSAQLPLPTTVDTLLLATDVPMTEAFHSSFCRKAQQAQCQRGVHIVESAFHSSLFEATYVALAKERGFLGEVDDLDVLKQAAALNRIFVLNAVTLNGEHLAYTVLMVHEERIEVRYPWRSPTAVFGTMNLLIVEAWKHAHLRGLPFLDLGGIPSQPTPSLDGILKFKMSTGGVRYSRQAFAIKF